MTDNLPASVREYNEACADLAEKQEMCVSAEIVEFKADAAIEALIAEVERLNRLLKAATETLEMLTDPCDDEQEAEG